MNKAHVRYLEARLIQTAARISHTRLSNGTAPPHPGLSEADIGKMEAFLEHLFLILPAVRVDLFVERARPAVKLAGPASGAVESPRFILVGKRHGIRATAILNDGEFIVEAGSQARSAWEGVSADTRGQLHEELRRASILQLQGDHCVFTQNYAFKSPSSAAAVVTGRSANGPMEWRTETGQTYKDWERATLGEALELGST